MTPDDLMFKPGLMKGQRILITGGGTGLGKVMAEACLILGAEVYICGRRGGVVEATAKELTDAHGGKCVGLACDIRVPEAIADMVDTVWADGGALTGLVNHSSAYAAGGVVPYRMGNAHPSVFPYEPLPTADNDMIVAAANDGQFRKLCDVLGVPESSGPTDPTSRSGPVRGRGRPRFAARRCNPRWCSWLRTRRRSWHPAP